MDELKIENSKNVIANSIVNANGDVLVNGQKITNYFYSNQYQHLNKEKVEWQERFNKTQQKIEKYPEDEDFKIELLKIDQKLNEVQKKLDDLKHEVIRLAETFTKIPINTERLKLAREYFEAGDYSKARAILDADQMGKELDELLQEKRQLQQKQNENEVYLTDKANEFLILARLTAIDFALSDYYDKAVNFFELSLKATHTIENTFEYAYFLQEHNQFNAAVPYYQKALKICHILSDVNPETYQPFMAMVLNGLANLQADRNQFLESEVAYQEALTIYRQLAEVNPSTYLPDVAKTLSNLGLLQKDQDQFREAESSYQKALGIYRSLKEVKHEAYLPEIAAIMNNLALLKKDTYQFPEAEAAFQEALTIYRRLANIYLPFVALTLNNLAALQAAKNQHYEAEAAYQDALCIRRSLAQVNPRIYLPDVALTLNNLGVLQKDQDRFREAESSYQEALGIYRTLNKVDPEAYKPFLAETLNNFGILRKSQYRYSEAEAAYQESLTIYRNLAEAYQPEVAMSLNNLGNLWTDQKQFLKAESGYQEALGIYRRLAEVNPEAYLPYVAMTALNLSIFFLLSVPNKEKSLTFVKETLLASLPFLDSIPSVQNYVEKAIQVVYTWGLDGNLFFQKMKKIFQERDKGNRS